MRFTPTLRRFPKDSTWKSSSVCVTWSKINHPHSSLEADRLPLPFFLNCFHVCFLLQAIDDGVSLALNPLVNCLKVLANLYPQDHCPKFLDYLYPQVNSPRSGIINIHRLTAARSWQIYTHRLTAPLGDNNYPKGKCLEFLDNLYPQINSPRSGITSTPKITAASFLFFFKFIPTG